MRPLTSLVIESILTSNRSHSLILFVVLIVYCWGHHTNSCSLSEEYSHYYQSGSFLFCHPSQVENWNQSVPFGEVSLPNPPDTISECASSDCQDMSGRQWTQASLPEDWTTVPAPDHSTWMQSNGNEWPNHGAPVTVQDIQALNTAAMLGAPQTSVDLGLSPVLSHESQSSHTLNSFSEPDTCVLPPGLDLSFAAESWNSSGPTMYHTPDVTSHYTLEYGFVPSHDQDGLSLSCNFSAPSVPYPGSQPPVFFPQGGQVPYQRRTVPYPHVPTPMRTLLPRTEGPATSVQATQGPQRALRPYMQGTHDSRRTVSSVSSTAGQSKDGSQDMSASRRSSGYAPVTSPQAQSLPHSSPGPIYPAAQGHPASVYYSQPGAPASMSLESAEDDFSSYIHFDQEEQTTPPGALRSENEMSCGNVRETDEVDSYHSGYGVQSTMSSTLSGDIKPVLSMPEQEVNAMYQGASSATSLTSDSDEGRHRNHPLYSEGPSSDGLYYCPFKAKDPNCPHKATKLKCNYEYEHLYFFCC